MGYKPGSGAQAQGQAGAEPQAGKPWKKHGNRNKKEKIRRLNKHLDAWLGLEYWAFYLSNAEFHPNSLRDFDWNWSWHTHGHNITGYIFNHLRVCELSNTLKSTDIPLTFSVLLIPRICWTEHIKTKTFSSLKCLDLTSRKPELNDGLLVPEVFFIIYPVSFNNKCYICSTLKIWSNPE